MKKLILSAFIVTAPFTALAAGGHGPAGCGLATEVIFKNADEFHEHLLAATTNPTASQTFAMTSGTLGCQDAKGPLASYVKKFITDNIDQLLVETSTGSGETLSALSELIGINAADDAAFKETLKTNFDQIFASIETTSDDVFDALVDVMSKDATLAKYLG